MTIQNIIVFGEKGSGKTSIVNLLTRQTAIQGRTSRDGDKVMRHPLDYDKYFYGEFVFYDTVGFSEDTNQKQLINNITEIKSASLQKRVEKLAINLAGNNGVSLAIMAIKHKSLFTQTTVKNYELLANELCSGKVPVILVVTGCERLADMGQWWTNWSSGFDVNCPKMKFVDVVCGCTKHIDELEGTQLSLERRALISIRRKRTKTSLESRISQHILDIPWMPMITGNANTTTTTTNATKGSKRKDSMAIGSAAFMIAAAGFLPIVIFGGAFCAAVGYLKRKPD